MSTAIVGEKGTLEPYAVLLESRVTSERLIRSTTEICATVYSLLSHHVGALLDIGEARLQTILSFAE